MKVLPFIFLTIQGELLPLYPFYIALDVLTTEVGKEKERHENWKKDDTEFVFINSIIIKTLSRLLDKNQCKYKLKNC